MIRGRKDQRAHFLGSSTGRDLLVELFSGTERAKIETEHNEYKKKLSTLVFRLGRESSANHTVVTTVNSHSLDHRYDIFGLVLAQMSEDGAPVLGALETAASDVDVHDHVILFAGQIVAPFQLVDLVHVLAARLIVSGRPRGTNN